MDVSQLFSVPFVLVRSEGADLPCEKFVGFQTGLGLGGNGGR